MIIKVCGIKDRDNHDRLCRLEVDMIGINFYPPSSRYIGQQRISKESDQKRVGVFVNKSPSEILENAERHHLDYAQLHGDENPRSARETQKYIRVIKVFRVDDTFDWQTTDEFGFADYFLFDTRTDLYGGSGRKFKWNSLEQYRGNTPFLLSGGIGPADVDPILNIDHPKFIGIDINSKFETEAGIKDVHLIDRFVKKIRN